jgi:hypothetical protein
LVLPLVGAIAVIAAGVAGGGAIAYASQQVFPIQNLFHGASYYPQ